MLKSSGVLLLLGCLWGSVPVWAQTERSPLEVYGGFDYVRFDVNANVPGFAPHATYNGYGGGGQIEYNANNWLGAVGDFAGYYVPSTGGAFSYLFGPRINLRRIRFTPFAQLLLGGIATTAGIGHLGAQNQFAMTAGGGIDVALSRHVAVRPVQAEYFMTRIPDGLDNRQDNFRFSTGVVLKLGK
jgi:hypothetical protein